jgi:hypothetical protein
MLRAAQRAAGHRVKPADDQLALKSSEFKAHPHRVYRPRIGHAGRRSREAYWSEWARSSRPLSARMASADRPADLVRYRLGHLSLGLPQSALGRSVARDRARHRLRGQIARHDKALACCQRGFLGSLIDLCQRAERHMVGCRKGSQRIAGTGRYWQIAPALLPWGRP